jgi:hypothetical protein
MPRFYCDLVLGCYSNRDEEGHEIESLRTVAVEAKRTAGELARDRLFKLQNASPEDIWVEVKGEHRQPVLTVTASVWFEWTRPMLQ